MADVHQHCGDRVDDAEDRCPYAYIAAQIARDRIPSAEQEIRRAQKEREREQADANIARGNGELLNELLNTSRESQVATVVSRIGIAAAVMPQSRAGSTVIP